MNTCVRWLAVLLTGPIKLFLSEFQWMWRSKLKETGQKALESRRLNSYECGRRNTAATYKWFFMQGILESRRGRIAEEHVYSILSGQGV